MQSLIHGNFEGAAQKAVYALVGAAAAIAAAVGPLLGGFITTYLSWRVAFVLEVVVIAVVLSGIRLVRDVPYTGSAGRRRRRRGPVGRRAWAASCWASSSGRRAARRSALLLAVGAVSLAGFAWWLVRRKRAGQADAASTRTCSGRKLFRFGISGQMLQQIALGGTMIALPIYLQMVLEYNAMQAGLSLAPLSLSMFAVALLAGKRAGDGAGRAASSGPGFALLPSAWSCWSRSCPAPTPAGTWRSRSSSPGSGLGLLVSQLNNYTLSPISEERVSEAAGVNSAAGSFGLSFGLAFAGRDHAGDAVVRVHQHGGDSTVLTPAEQQQVATGLEHDAEVMSNTELEEQLVGQPPDVQAEIIRINTEARPLALQVALLVPILAGLLGPGDLVPDGAAAGSGVVRRGRRPRPGLRNRGAGAGRRPAPAPIRFGAASGGWCRLALRERGLDLGRVEVPQDQDGHQCHPEADAGASELDHREDRLEQADARDDQAQTGGPTAGAPRGRRRRGSR